MRTLCGRLKSDYRYAKDIVYNNFPWPKPTKEQKEKIEKIEKTAQAIWGAPHRRRVFILFQIY